MLLNSPIILSGNSFYIHLLFSKLFPHSHKLFLQEVALFSKTRANILIRHKQLYLVINKKHEKLSTARVVAIDTQNI